MEDNTKTYKKLETVEDPIGPCVGTSLFGYKCVIEHGHGETSCGLVPRWWNLPARLGF